jgi:hypothetical protein
MQSLDGEVDTDLFMCHVPYYLIIWTFVSIEFNMWWCNWCCCSVDRNKYQIQIPLPPKIDPSVTMMTVEEKPDVTYNDVGGCKEQIEKMREVCQTFFTC